MDKVALGQVFSEYFGFPCQFSEQSSWEDDSHLAGQE
jgi:hypothetical protein